VIKSDYLMSPFEWLELNLAYHVHAKFWIESLEIKFRLSNYCISLWMGWAHSLNSRTDSRDNGCSEIAWMICLFLCMEYNLNKNPIYKFPERSNPCFYVIPCWTDCKLYILVALTTYFRLSPERLFWNISCILIYNK